MRLFREGSIGLQKEEFDNQVTSDEKGRGRGTIGVGR